MNLRPRLRKRSHLQTAIKYCKDKSDRPSLTSRWINDEIGYGTFACYPFFKNEFLLEYRGELLHYREAIQRENMYPPSRRSYMYFFKFNERSYCVDATTSTGNGRLVNDAPKNTSKCNCRANVVEINGQPYLCLFSTRSISAGEELRYDYGVSNLPWRNKEDYLEDDPFIDSPVPLGNEDKITGRSINGEPVPPLGNEDELTGSSINEEPVPPLGNEDKITGRSINGEPVTPLGNEDEITGSSINEEPVPPLGNEDEITGSGINEEPVRVVTNDISSLENISFCGLLKIHTKNNCNNKADGRYAISEVDEDDVVPTSDQEEEEHGKVHPHHRTFKPEPDERSMELGTLPESSYKPPQQGRPQRFCPFCSKTLSGSQLTRHIKRIHKHEDEVQMALKMPRKKQHQLFANMKKRGIHIVNREEVLKGIQHVTRLRAQGNSDVIICSLCKGTYSKKNFRKHKKRCMSVRSDELQPISLPLSALSLHEEDSNFNESILKKMRDDEVGQLAKSDPSIVTVGKCLWQEKRNKKDKLIEGRKSVIRAMRRLANLFKHFRGELKLANKEVPHATASASDMFKRMYFQELEFSVIHITDSEGDNMKYGLKNELKYLIKKSAWILRSNFLILEEDESAKEIEQFLVVFDMRKHSLFSDAEYQLQRNRQIKHRKPVEQPLDSDIDRIKEYIHQEMSHLINEEDWTTNKYSQLRDLQISRLTLYNARRGGEPCRMTLDEWEDAAKDSWIQSSAAATVQDPLEIELLKTTKIAFQSGKGNNRLVSVLIPEDCIRGLELLADSKIRKICGVNPSNKFLFPFTQSSLEHPSGWHAVNRIAKAAKVECIDKMTATSMRHRTSTLYAMLDIPEYERDRFYDHMGHSSAINKHVYQAPLAVTTITKVGKQLHHFDKGKAEGTGYHCN